MASKHPTEDTAKNSLRPQVGEKWDIDDEDIKISRRKESNSSTAVQSLLVICCLLLAVLTVYGMLDSDTEFLDRILLVLRDLVIAMLGWATGQSKSP